MPKPLPNFLISAGTYQKRILEKMLSGDEISFSHLEPSFSKTRGRIPRYKLHKDGEQITESLFAKLMCHDFLEHKGKNKPGEVYKLSQEGTEKARKLCDVQELQQPTGIKNNLTKAQLEKYHKHLDTLKNNACSKGYVLTPEVVEILEKEALKQLNTPTQRRESSRVVSEVSSEDMPTLKSNSTGRRNQFRRSVYLRKNVRSRHRQ